MKEEKNMMIKTLVCGVVLGCIAAFAAMLDRGHARALDSQVQMPTCSGSDMHCGNMSSTAMASTERFFAMMAMH